MLPYIQKEASVAAVTIETDFDQYVKYTCLPNLAILGKKLGKDLGKVKKAILALDKAQIEAFL